MEDINKVEMEKVKRVEFALEKEFSVLRAAFVFFLSFFFALHSFK
jgi:hypothetical protein